MKKRLNFITLLIGIALCASFYNSENYLAFKEGTIEGIRMAQNEMQENRLSESFFITLEPVDFLKMPNTLLNVKSGELLSTRIREAVVSVPVIKKTIAYSFWNTFCSFFYIAGMIIVLYSFIKIIIAVNKSVIFEWINVKRLRRMGIGFLLMFVSDIITSVIYKYAVLKIVEIENYEIINRTYNGSILLLGIIALLVAEIFAVGLRLKEEQELTI